MKSSGKSSKPIIAAGSTKHNEEQPAQPDAQGSGAKRVSRVPNGRLRTQILERVSDGVLAFDAQMNHVYVDERAGELLGREPGQLVGKTFWEAYPNSAGTPFADACQRAFKTQNVVPFDGYFPSTNSWFEGRVYPSDDGLSVLISDRGLPDQEEIIHALEISEEKFSKAFHSSPVAKAIVRTRDQNFVDINQSFLNLFKLDREDVIGKATGEVGIQVLPASMESLTQVWKRKGSVRQHEAEIENRSGEKRHVLLSVEQIELDAEACLLLSAMDITERKRAEEQIRGISEFPMQNPNPVMRLRRDAELLFANPAAAPLVNFWKQPDGVLTLPTEVRQILTEVMESQENKQIELEGRGKTFNCLFVPVPGANYINLYFSDITERIQAQESLQALVHQTTAGITRIDLKGNYQFANQAFCDMVGYSASELMDKTIWEISQADDITRNQRMFERMASEGTPYHLEKRLVRRNGTVLWVTIGTSPLRDARGQVQAAVSVIVDITRRKRAEESLLDSARRTLYLSTLSDTLRQLATPTQIEIEAPVFLGTHLNASRVAYAAVNEAGIATIRSNYVDGMPDLTGEFPLHTYLPADALQKLYADRTYFLSRSAEPLPAARDADLVRAQVIVPLMRQDKLVAVLFVQQNQEREWRSEDLNLMEETAERMQAAIERAYAERDLHESEKRFRILANTVPSLVWSTRPDGKVEYLNDRWLAYTGLTFEESVSGWEQTVHPDDYERCIQAWDHSLTTGEEYMLELRYRRYDGEYRWFQSHAIPERNDDGQIIAWHGVTTDIHERVQREAEVQEVINHTPFMLTRCSRDLRYRFVSRAYAEMVGRTPEELAGRSIQEVMGESGMQTILPHVQKALQGERVEYEAEVPFEGVGTPILHIVYVPDYDEQGEVVGWFGSLSDVTARRRVENALRESEEKLTAELSDSKQLQAISSQMIQENNINVLYEQIIEAASVLMRSDMASMQMLDPETKQLRLLAWKGFHPEAAAFWEWVPIDSSSTCSMAMSSGKRVIVTDVDTADFLNGTNDLDFFRLSGIKAVQSTPLISREGRLVGMISTHWKETHQSSERDLQLLDVLARQAADLIERKLAEERYTVLFNSIHEGFAHYKAIYDDRGNIKDLLVLEINPAGAKLSGVSREDQVGKTWRQVWPGVGEELFARYQQVDETGNTLRFEDDNILTGRVYEILVNRIAQGEFSAAFNDVTERKQVEEALRTSEEKYRQIVETAHEGIWELDEHARTSFVNARMATMLGYTPEEMLGRSPYDFLIPEDRPRAEQRLHDAMQGVATYSNEFRYRRKDGSVLWTLSGSTPKLDQDGNFIGSFAMLTDISERKQNEESLVEYARRQTALYTLADALNRIETIQDIYESSLDAIVNALQCERASILLFDDSQRMRFVAWRGLSEEYRKATDGHSPWEYGEQNPTPITYNDITTADLNDSLKDVIAREEIGSLAFIPIVLQGRLIGKFMVYFNTQHPFSETELDLSLTISRQLASAIDRKQREETLRARNEEIEALMRVSPFGILVAHDPACKEITGNPAAYAVLRVNIQTQNNLSQPVLNEVGQSHRVFRAGVEVSEQSLPMQMAARQGKEVENQALELRFEDGTSKYIYMFAKPLFDSEGNTRGAIAAVLDITERMQREETLRARTEEIETLMDVSPIGIYVAHDPQCTRITGNPAAYNLVNMPQNDDANISKSASAEEQPAYRVFREGVELGADQLPMQAAARLGKEIEEEALELRFDNGLHRYVYAYAKPLFDANGKTRGAVAAMLDITERKKNEEALRLDSTIMENVPAGVYLIRASDRTIIHTNPTFNTLFGYEPGEILGKHVSVINAPTERSPQEVAEAIIAALQEQGSWQGEVWSVRKDGTPFWTFASVTTFEHTTYGRVWVAARQDISERKQAEDRLALLAEITDLTRKHDDPIELMKTVAETMGKYLHVKRCLFNEIDLDHDLETVHSDYHVDTHSVAGVHKITDYSSITTQEMIQGRTVVNHDSKLDPRTAQDYERSYVPNGERAYVTVPLMRGGRWVASLWVSDDKPRVWSPYEVSLLETVAERTWTATEKLRIHVALRDSEERLRVTYNSTAVGFATLNPDTSFVEVNQAFCNIVGYSREELSGMLCDSLNHPDHLESSRAHIAQLLAGEVPSFVVEKIYIRRDGSEIWVQNSVSLVRDAEGKPLHMIVITQDITERKRAEDALHQLNLQLETRVQQRTAELQSAYEFLRQSEATARLILESTPDAIVVVDKNGQIVYGNTRVESLFGYSSEEFLGKSVEVLVPGRFHEQHLAYRQEYGTLHERRNMGLGTNIHGQRKDNTEFPVEVMLSPISNNTTWDVMITIRDNTQQKEAQEALRANEEKLRKLFAILPVGISFLDHEGKISEMNAALSQIMGLTKSELMEGRFKPRRYIRANGSPMPPAEFASNRARNEQKPVYNVETGIIKEGGDIIWTSVSATPVDVADVDMVVATIDITERKKAEDTLHKHRERLRILSRRLVEVQEDERRAIAHELHDRVGQNLAALNLNLNILRSQLSAEALKVIGTRLDDSVALVNQILTITRNVMSDLRSNVLDDYGLEAALHEFSDKFTQRTGVQVLFDKTGKTLPRLDPNVEMTLLRIAQEALTNVSRHAQADSVTVTTNMDSEAVYMSIEDSGIGILSWQKANQPGSHGLRIIRERAEAFGGSLQVHSAYKKGTRIEVKIPLGNTGSLKIQREKRS